MKTQKNHLYPLSGKHLSQVCKTCIVKGSICAFGAALLFFTTFSCEDFVEIDPPTTEITTEALFEDRTAIVAALNGLYSEILATPNNMFNAGLEIFTGTASGEFINYSSDRSNTEFALNDLQPDNIIVNNNFWTFAYQIINQANLLIEGISGASFIDPRIDQALGEALFMRAFTHFYLVNLFGEVPYVSTTGIATNNSIGKTSVALIYENITADLTRAQFLMMADYSFVSNEERVRPNRGAATALLARVYLYLEDWANAEVQATQVIDNDLYALDTVLNDVFKPASPEAIWQLIPNTPGINTNQGFRFLLDFILPGDGLVTTSMSNDLVNTFDPSDNRLSSWVGTRDSGEETFYYPFKYKEFFRTGDLPDEYTVVFRLAEQYLIRSEARTRQNNISGAREDLNIIRNRAGLGDTPASDQPSLLDAIMQERKVELFAEWGHRWLDLKRNGRIDRELSNLPEKGGRSDKTTPAEVPGKSDQR